MELKAFEAVALSNVLHLLVFGLATARLPGRDVLFGVAVEAQNSGGRCPPLSAALGYRPAFSLRVVRDRLFVTRREGSVDRKLCCSWPFYPA
jgi:hypothetical protein